MKTEEEIQKEFDTNVLEVKRGSDRMMKLEV